MILALDYGEKNTGIAISDEEEIFSFPLDVLPTTELKKNPKKLEVQVRNFSKVTEIIIGLPKNLKNEDTPQTQKARIFYDLIQKSFPLIKVCLVDERLTSAQLIKNIHSSGGSAGKMRSTKDKYEAALLLEFYLQWKKNEKERMDS